MQGIIFNLLEEAVTLEHGPTAWDDVLSFAHSDGVFTSLGTYSDEQFRALIGATSAHLNRPANEVLCWFGRAAMPMLIERYPRLVSAHGSVRSLLLSVNQVVHREVLKIYPGSVLPLLEVREEQDCSLLVVYRSHRQLCALAQGFAEGAAEHYGESLGFRHLKCMQQGDDHCLIRVAIGS